MALTCGDCFYIHKSDFSDKWKCKKKYETRDLDSPACSSFVHEDTPDCCDCAFCEPTTFSFKCTVKNKKLSSPSEIPACSSFSRG